MILIEAEYERQLKFDTNYYGNVNRLRQISRELFTEARMAADTRGRVDELLEDARDTLFFHGGDNFASNFINNEVRNADMYEEGSELRRLATVKELFATHLCLYWMATKELSRSGTSDNNLTQEEVEKLRYIIRSVKSLISNRHLLEHISEMNTIIAENEKLRGLTSEDLKHVLVLIEPLQTDEDFDAKFKDLVHLYELLSKFFMHKVGKYSLPLLKTYSQTSQPKMVFQEEDEQANTK